MYLVTAVLALLTACTSCAHFGSRRSAVQQHNAMVMIKTTCPDGNSHAGTGVLVSEDRVLTANHVAQCDMVPGFGLYVDPVSVEVFASTDDKSTATVELTIPGADIARLKLTHALPEFFTGVEVGPPPGIGDRICEVTAVPRVMYRCGEAQKTVSGRIMFSFMTEFGNSGSAVYNSDGQLVGIVTNLIRCQEGVPCAGFGSSLTGYAWLIP
jgi:hypothetical protein